jgi:hypothetical protein
MVCPTFTYGWRPEDARRVMRMLARPLLVGIVVALVAIALLLGARGMAPFITGAGVTSPQFAIQSQERERDEQRLQAETSTFLQSVSDAAAAKPAHVGDEP